MSISIRISYTSGKPTTGSNFYTTNRNIILRYIIPRFNISLWIISTCTSFWFRINISSHYCPVKAGKSVFEIVET